MGPRDRHREQKKGEIEGELINLQITSLAWPMVRQKHPCRRLHKMGPHPGSPLVLHETHI